MKKGKRTAALAIAFSLLASTAAFAGTWEGQEGSWKYRNDDGNYAASQWVNDQGNWYYVEADGLMKTGWYQDAAGAWYYLEPGSGVMAVNTTKDIDGTSYSFDGSGVWIQAASTADGWNGLTYTDHGMDYQFTIPSNYSISNDLSLFGDNAKYMKLVVSSSDGGAVIAVALFDMPEIAQSDISAREMAETMAQTFQGPQTVETVNFNGCTYEKAPLMDNVPLMDNLSFSADTYFRKVGNQIVMIETVYTSEHKAEIDGILATVKSAN